MVVDIDNHVGAISGIPWFERVFGSNKGYHVYFKYDSRIKSTIFT